MKIQWHDTEQEIILELNERVADELRRDMDIDHPSSLCFHHIFLDPTGDTEGPTVFVWGEPGSDAFHCRYEERTVWMTMFELEQLDDSRGSC